MSRRVDFFFIVVLLFLLLPANFLIFKSGIYPSHDGLLHIQRIGEFYQALSLGQIPARIAPGLNQGIGVPLFIANYQLPYYLAGALVPFGGVEVAFKASLAVSYILSGVFAYAFFRRQGSAFAGFIGALFYCYLPYRFANMYARGALGESVALMFVPLVFLAIDLVCSGKKSGIPLLAFSVFGLVTSHNLVFAIFVPLILIFILLKKPPRKIIFPLFFGFFLGGLLSSFQLLPVIFERKYLILDNSFLPLYKGHLLSIFQILRIPHPGINTGTPFQAGIASFVVILAALLLGIRRKNSQILVLALVCFASLFLISTYSLALWQNLPFLQYIIFPWRFFSPFVFTTAWLAVFVFDNIKLRYLAGIVALLLLVATGRHYFLHPTQLVSTAPVDFISGPVEYVTIWSNDSTFAAGNAVLPSNRIFSLRESPYRISFEIEQNRPGPISIRRIYFPGWIVLVDDENVDLVPNNGLISFNVAPGKHFVEVTYRESPLREVSDWLTVAGLAVLFFILLRLYVIPLVVRRA